MSQEDRLEIIATKSFKSYEEMYKLVDFLNKNLKEKRVMLGLKKQGENMTVSIYDF